jgi:GNAT superfamily N-acetyltransferase
MAGVADLGWIIALSVDPQQAGRGLGGRLLAAAEEQLRRQGAARCDIGGSVGHLLPGPPADDERALGFWRRHGYQPARLVHDLYRPLDDWVPAMAQERDGWRIAPGAPGQEAALLAFLQQSFPGRWHYHLADSLARGARIEDIVLLHAPDGPVAGFVATWPDTSPLLGPASHWFPAIGPRFGGVGPLGIATAARGLGLGLAMVASAVTLLQARGVAHCTIDWTDLTAFYARLGFRPWRAYWRCQPKEL